jgi:hypothetical protein
VLGDIADFAECCATQGWFWDQGWISLPTAVDNLQFLAERWLLIEQHGQHAVQDCIAWPFAQLRADPEPDSGVEDIVRRLEMADARDRWKHSGEPPPPSEVRNGPMPAAAPWAYRTAQSTIDAFFHLFRNESSEYLKGWLARHPVDAPFLLKIWKQKNARETAIA